MFHQWGLGTAEIAMIQTPEEAAIEYLGRQTGFKREQFLKVRFIRNTVSSKKFVSGNAFQQDIEPHGQYFLIDDHGGSLSEGWERGSKQFRKPLLIKWNTSTSGGYDTGSWKAQLQRICKAKGQMLSVKLRRMGYDAIITFHQVQGKWEPSECVDLTTIPY